MTSIEATANILELRYKAEELPPELREFGLAVVQVLAQLYGLLGVVQLQLKLNDSEDHPTGAACHNL